MAAKEQFKIYDPVEIRSSSSKVGGKEIMLSEVQVVRIRESWTCRIVLVGRDLKLILFHPVLWAGIPSTTPGCFKPRLTWP